MGPDVTVCARIGCEGEGAWHPVIVLVHKSRPDAEVPSVLSVKVCDAHKESGTLVDWMGDEQWDFFARAFAAQGLATPTRALTRLDWAKEPPFNFPPRTS